MANLNLTEGNKWTSASVYDTNREKTQEEINAEQTGFDLYPTGNQDNRSTEIVACFNQKRVCRLAPGTYYVNNFIMRANSSLIGVGPATKLIFNDPEAWYAIRMRSNTTIANLTLDGQADGTPLESYAGPDYVHGIRIGDNTTSNPSDTEDYECTIENVIIKNFTKGCGIFARYSGQKSQGGGVFKNVRAEKCSVGFYLGEHAEYYTLIGCHANECYTGLVNIGGNNIVSGCVFGRNEIGINMPGSDAYGTCQNAAHGIITGCKITHCGTITGTDGFGIKSEGQTGNMLFSGCMFGYPLYFRSRGRGLQFSGCTVKGLHSITVDHCVVTMLGTMFEDNEQDRPEEKPAVTILNGGILRRRGCLAFDGTELKDVPEPEPENNG